MRFIAFIFLVELISCVDVPMRSTSIKSGLSELTGFSPSSSATDFVSGSSPPEDFQLFSDEALDSEFHIASDRNDRSRKHSPIANLLKTPPLDPYPFAEPPNKYPKTDQDPFQNSYPSTSQLPSSGHIPSTNPFKFTKTKNHFLRNKQIPNPKPKIETSKDELKKQISNLDLNIGIQDPQLYNLYFQIYNKNPVFDPPFYKRFLIYPDIYLGHGTFGVVFAGIDLRTNQYVAIKVGILTPIEMGKVFRGHTQEMIILLYMKRKNIPVIEYVDSGINGNIYYIVTTLVYRSDSKQSFTEFAAQYLTGLKNDNRFIDLCFTFLQSLTNSLVQLHEIGVTHNDIKPEVKHNNNHNKNILINEQHQLILADFGNSLLNETVTEYAYTTYTYASPQQLKTYSSPGSFYNTKANDVWSLGVVFFNMLHGGEQPYKIRIHKHKYSPIYSSDFNWTESFNSKLSLECFILMSGM